jgi:hypothetical protein
MIKHSHGMQKYINYTVFMLFSEQKRAFRHLIMKFEGISFIC